MPGWLFALLFAAFVFYTDDYVIAGVLPEIANDLGISAALTGQLVTVFSVTVAIAAPVAAVIFAQWARRVVLSVALIGFIVANALAALSDSYSLLVVLRIGAALAAAMATPTLFGVAASLAPTERRGRYLGTVSLGVTGSIALGVPLGTWLGGQSGWRAAFAAMAIGGVLAMVWLLATLPRTEPSPPVPLREQARVLLAGGVSLGLLANALMITGSMMLLTYLAPFAAELANADTGHRVVLFAASGIAGMVGIWLGGIATDRWGPNRTLVYGMTVFIATMLAFSALWPLRPVTLWIMAPLAVLWAGTAFWNAPALQARLLRLAGPVGTQALAVNNSGTYLGVATGGALGGALLGACGGGALPVVSAALGALALLTFYGATLTAGDARRATSPVD
ncbi:putative MFS family arabinose efflux permease [Tamaricihabitans halophyticus]|uniref:Putative MFS family arabinose efflux permease n=1 Tax=Tamaricihabitans halophyticus TaxID=1262583 RepID=A0A4R2Q886_9PSEU|nr:MFS transporter [Tamaricihabitans halophyticus]TCP44739.1 putative MFS family arabinose efflux permease [Tamaricihabitans halophyticus]